MNYDKSQTATLLLAILSIALVSVTLIYFNGWGSESMPLIVYILITVVIIVIMLLFYKLKVKIDSEGIHLIYGVGLICINLKPEEVIKVEPTRMPFYYGYGIRFTPRGMLYNIQGTHVVKLTYVKQKQMIVFIGTAHAQELANAILKRYN